ncbi:hypothetical protein TcCL_Unassigned00736 [Trypanosoma cruzi]|nr:hypothetical protein TcCL_Unassigned00736 [Trypanosoma cruzi]
MTVASKIYILLEEKVWAFNCPQLHSLPHLDFGFYREFQDPVSGTKDYSWRYAGQRCVGVCGLLMAAGVAFPAVSSLHSFVCDGPNVFTGVWWDRNPFWKKSLLHAS